MPASPRRTRTPSARPPRRVDSSAPPDPAGRRKLWLFVGAATVVIVAVWVALVGLNLGRTSTGEDSLYERIKREIQAAFGGGETSETEDASLTNRELDDLERRVFPNVSGVPDQVGDGSGSAGNASRVKESGTFTIP